ncbi:hypothetical protein B9Z19DRAFT_1129442 [Tuber borchii]|uniref:Uncharacterized protein n=1 Tax=Tuber borchii TaxID=42251 RepID=A0A2T6ZM90_TUBBO|nr:hypothetical protein B9Z19DRAFT_1129442 [Tuber borchii]
MRSTATTLFILYTLGTTLSRWILHLRISFELSPSAALTQRFDIYDTGNPSALLCSTIAVSNSSKDEKCTLTRAESRHRQIIDNSKYTPEAGGAERVTGRGEACVNGGGYFVAVQ